MSVVKHYSAEEAKASHLEFLQEAIISGKWMAMIWYVGDNGMIHARNVTHSFPVGEFDAAIKHLRDACANKREESVEFVPTPLPRANRKGPGLPGELFSGIEGFSRKLGSEENEEDEKNTPMD